MSHLVGPTAARSDPIGGCHTPDPRRYGLISTVLGSFMGRKIAPGLRYRVMSGERSLRCRSWTRWRLHALNAVSSRRSSGSTGACVDIPRPPPGGLAHSRSLSRASLAFACLRAFRLRAFLHNVCAGGGALRSSRLHLLRPRRHRSSIRGPRYPQSRPSYLAPLRTAARASPSRTFSCPPSIPHTVSDRRDTLSGWVPTSSDAAVLAVATCRLMHER